MIDSLSYVSIFRNWARHPLFFLASVLLVSLGVGVTTTLFSLMYPLILQPLPVDSPSEIAHFVSEQPGGYFDRISELNSRRGGPFASLFGWFGGAASEPLEMSVGGSSSPVNFALISGNGFQVLGLQPSAGQWFSSRDDVPGGGDGGWKAAISEDLWKSRFGSDQKAIGSTILLNHIPVTIVSVVPSRFGGMMLGEQYDVYLPLEFMSQVSAPPRHDFGSVSLDVYGRLRPGFQLKDAQAFLRREGPGWISQLNASQAGEPMSREDRTWYLNLLELESGEHGHTWIGGDYQLALKLALGMAVMLLLLCSVSLSGLVMARLAHEEKQLAIRLMLGETRLQLFGRVVAEIVPVLLIGIAFSLMLAGKLAAFLVQGVLGATPVPLSFRFQMHFPMALVACGCALVAGGMACAYPMIKILGRQNALDLSGRNTSSSKLTFGLILPAQFAISTALAVSAILFGATFVNLMRTPLGFQPGHLLIYHFAASQADRVAPVSQTPTDPTAFYSKLFTALRSMPGVAQVTTFASGPLGAPYADTRISAGGRSLTGNADFVGPDYFSSIGAQILAGRGFRETERGPQPNICVLSNAASAAFYPDHAGVGRSVSYSDPVLKRNISCQVVGIVADARFARLREPARPSIYLPLFEAPYEDARMIAVRATDVRTADASVREILKESFPRLRVGFEYQASEEIHRAFGRERVLAALAEGFGMIALVTTSIGLFSTLAFRMRNSRKEVAIRLALGSSRQQVCLHFLRLVLAICTPGIMVGLLIAWESSRYAQVFLFSLKAHDPGPYGQSLLVSLAVLIGGALLPILRAARISPSAVLKEE